MALHTRRAVLRTAGAGAVGLAGCNRRDTDRTPTTTTATATEAPDRVDPAQAGIGGDPDPPTAEVWPQPYRTPAKTAYLASGPGFTSAPAVAWTRTPTTDQDEYSPAFTPPVVVGDELYTVRTLRFGPEVPQPESHYLTALTPAGDDRWTAPVTTTDDSTPVPTAAAVHDDVVLVGVDQLVQAFERATGDQIWSVVVGEQVAGVTATPERVYVRASRSVAAVTVGGRRWTTAFEAFPDTLAVGTDAVFVTTRRRLHRLDPASGEVTWTRQLPAGEGGDAVDRLLTVPDGVIARQQGGHLTAYTTAGAQVWRTRGIADALATDGTTLYAGTSGSVRALNVANGDVVWERSCRGIPGCTGDNEPLSLAATADAVYVPLADDRLAALASRDGSVRWSRPTPDWVERIALTADAVYAVGGSTDPLVRFAG